jgi:low affinity Fe/Cu permease
MAAGPYIMQEFFDRFTTGCARFAGRPAMLVLCIAICGIGVTAYFSRDELFISGANLAISIVTLMLLPILQATQNRDGAALQAKIDELIKSNSKARDDLIGLENRGQDEIERIRIDEGQRAKATARRRSGSRVN